MTAIADIIKRVESLAGHPLNKDEGVHHGTAERRVSGATVAWMATPAAIEAAGKNGHELLIVHESLYFPYNVVNMPNPPPGWQSWKVNSRRRALLEQQGLTCLRIHGSADEICVFDRFAGLLALGKPVFADGLAKVYEIPECSLDELVSRVKRLLGMSVVRVARAGNGARMVKRVGLPWGGLGLFVNVAYQQRLVELGCDVFIAGEADNYGFRFAVESGISMIETSHEISENPGIRNLTDILAQAFPELDFKYHENECVWKPG